MHMATRVRRIPHGGQYYRITGLLSRAAINLVLLAFSVACLVPFIIVVSASFSSESAITKYGYTLLPKQVSFSAYQFIFSDTAVVLRSYGVSGIVTVVGSAASMIVMSLMAYALSRKRFALRQPIAFYIFFTMLFSGGLVPSYILITRYLQLRDTLGVLIIPGLVSGWNVLILRTFFADIPDELLDAARIDGAGEWRTFFQIAVPLSTPGLATIGLFTMLAYWNDFYAALLYIEKSALYPIQYLLYVVLVRSEFLMKAQQSQSATAGSAVSLIPVLPLRMAMAVLAMAPITLGYFFVQKYFIRGIRLGSIKG
jgi:putative aldouronate transport system permease protein